MEIRSKSRMFYAVLSFAVVAVATVSFAQKVTTVAGGFVGDGRKATQASFQIPYGWAHDSSGNTYIADSYAQRIRKIASNGTISTYVDGTGIAGYNGENIPASSAQVYYPIGLALDAANELLFADSGNNRVRKVNTSGNVVTLAGNGTPGYSGDGGPATAAELNGPNNIVVDPLGNIYISDNNNNVVRKVDLTGTITTFAGNGTAGFCGDGGPATQACLKFPRGLVFDTKGNLYICDGGNRRVRIVTPAGIINTFAGNGSNTFSGDGGKATLAAIGNPTDLTFANGSLYISNGGDSRVRFVKGGIINTFIGSNPGYDGDGHPPLSSELDSPYGIGFVSTSVMQVVDRFNARVRQLSGGALRTTAGGYIGDNGPATSAAFVLPQSVAFDTAGNMYVLEWSGNRVRKIDAAGNISTVAGTGTSGYTGDNGPATAAQLDFPQGLVVDSSNNIYISDQGNNVIRKVDSSGTITTFSTNANFGGALAFMALDATQTLYVADAGACVVWKIDGGGNATIAAGELFNCGYNGDGIPATSALLNSPWGVAFDSANNMMIADSVNNRIREVNAAGTISTFAGNGTTCDIGTDPCGDGGSATAAALDFPISVRVSGKAVYIADNGDLRIRKVAGGIITGYAGTGIGGYNGDKLPALSTNFDDPLDMAVNPTNGILYYTDDAQSRVRRIH